MGYADRSNVVGPARATKSGVYGDVDTTMIPVGETSIVAQDGIILSYEG